MFSKITQLTAMPNRKLPNELHNVTQYAFAGPPPTVQPLENQPFVTNFLRLWEQPDKQKIKKDLQVHKSHH